MKTKWSWWGRRTPMGRKTRQVWNGRTGSGTPSISTWLFPTRNGVNNWIRSGSFSITWRERWRLPRENLRQAQARASRTEREQAQSLLKEFDKKVRLQREILDTHLETALNGYVGNAIEEVRDRIQRDDEVEGENASPALGLWTFRSMRKASLRKSTS